MLFPKRTKFRKYHRHRGIFKRKATRGTEVVFGDYGIQALGAVWLTQQQIEAARTALSRALPRGKIWIRVFPDVPYTKKPAESRMGKGKGNVEGWVAVVLPGRIIFEFTGVSPEEAKEVHRKVAAKLPIPTRLKTRFHFGGERK
ncbi:MAG TPA: 50S ribosomal protein L16 [Candidatus Acetothermia bacterium]|nr:50S ribosomal protein L16 [Candidatus Acetothermia bacterium]